MIETNISRYWNGRFFLKYNLNVFLMNFWKINILI